MKSYIEIKVRGYHEDHFKHVNHTRYLEFLEEGRWAYFENHDLVENLFHKKGIFLAVVNIAINYLKSARAGDILCIETSVKNIGKRKIVFSQKIHSKISNELIADANITNVIIGAKDGNLVAIDDEMIHSWPELGTCMKC